MNRLQFLGQTLAATSAGTLLGAASARAAAEPQAPTAAILPRKIRIGIIGCGKRGLFLGEIFKQHGGYEIAGAADYFPDRVNDFAAKFSLRPDQIFTGLKCHEQLIAAGGLDAVAIISPPYFHPEQAAAGVGAGLHVYLAKPIAVDVPGCRSVKDSAAAAAKKGLTFLVDFQTRANEFYIEAMKRVHAGALGKMVFGEAQYHAGRLSTQGSDAGPEGRLRNWVFDKALSGDIIVEQNIHALDVMSWSMQGTPPLRCSGLGGRKVRVDVGDSWDYYSCVFEYPDKVGVNFNSRQYPLDTPGGIINKMYGSRGALLTEYGGTVMIRGPKDVFYQGGKTGSIYRDGAVANIRSFHDAILAKDCSNTTVEPSVTSNLIAIMGRTAAYTGRSVTWDEIMDSKTALDGRLDGLKA